MLKIIFLNFIKVVLIEKYDNITYEIFSSSMLPGCWIWFVCHNWQKRYCVIVNNVITWTWLNLCTKVITSCFAWLQFLELTKVFGQNIFLIFKNGHFVWSNLFYSSFLMLIQAKVKQLLVRNFYWSSRNVTS